MQSESERQTKAATSFATSSELEWCYWHNVFAIDPQVRQPTPCRKGKTLFNKFWRGSYDNVHMWVLKPLDSTCLNVFAAWCTTGVVRWFEVIRMPHVSNIAASFLMRIVPHFSKHLLQSSEDTRQKLWSLLKPLRKRAYGACYGMFQATRVYLSTSSMRRPACDLRTNVGVPASWTKTWQTKPSLQDIPVTISGNAYQMAIAKQECMLI